MQDQCRVILLGIEDPERQELQDLIESIYMNVEYVEVDSGSVGLMTCIDQDIDAVFIPYYMIDMDGLEFVEQLRDAAQCMVPIFLMVREEHKRAAQHAVSCGANEYFIINDLNHHYFRCCVSLTLENFSLNNRLKLEIQKMQAARILVDRANQSRYNFLSTMSHEIRTPLNGVVGISELLKHTTLNAEQSDYVQTISSSSNSLMHIVDDILDYGKIESGKLELECRDFSLRDVVHETIDAMVNKSRAKGLELACLIYPNVPDSLRGDSERIAQVIKNLLSNAIKFTKEGVVSIDILIEKESSRMVELRFVISDTGVGLAQAQKEKIFRPFLQGDGSASRAYGGAGLGLSICRQLVEMMGGAIGIDCNEDKGMSCWVTIPLQVREQVEELEADYNFNNKKVLIVDDNITSLFVLSRQMEFIGIECVALEQSNLVLDILEQAAHDNCPFDLALVDLNMPDPDGWVLAQKISRCSVLKKLPLVLLSATPKHYHHEQALAAGYHACLSKPIREKVLVDCLAKVFSGERELRTDLIRKDTESFSADAHVEGRVGLHTDMNYHILLAEDNIVNQKVAMRMLRKLGCTVDVAENGRQAIELIQQQTYDMVFMDCQMPVMDGYESTQHIRALGETYATVPIVALTANAMTGDRDKCLECGMNDHVGKPFSLDDLYAALDKWVLSIV